MAQQSIDGVHKQLIQHLFIKYVLHYDVKRSVAVIVSAALYIAITRLWHQQADVDSAAPTTDAQIRRWCIAYIYACSVVHLIANSEELNSEYPIAKKRAVACVMRRRFP